MTALRQVVIVAGGAGSRVAEVSGGRPKILLRVSGRPFLEWLIDWSERQGFAQAHFCLGIGAGHVASEIERISDRPIRLTYSVESMPLGTAGALRHATDWLDDEFAVVVGDSYMPIKVDAVVREWRASRLPAGMVVIQNFDEWVPSNVAATNGMVCRYDKCGVGTGLPLDFVDYGMMLLRKRLVLDLPPHIHINLSELINRLIQHRHLGALEVHHQFYEIGSLAGYQELCRICRDAGPLVALPEREDDM